MSTLQSLDITRRSATTSPSPSVREIEEVAKLIGISKCIGCKACQAACYEWNDLRDEIGINIGSYQNPYNLTENTWTLMRFSEVEPEDGKLEWLIRKDGCMHCADGPHRCARPFAAQRGSPVASFDEPSPPYRRRTCSGSAHDPGSREACSRRRGVRSTPARTPTRRASR